MLPKNKKKKRKEGGAVQQEVHKSDLFPLSLSSPSLLRRGGT